MDEESLLCRSLPQIAEFLGARDVGRLAQCSRALSAAVSDDEALWVHFLVRAGVARAWNRGLGCTAREFFLRTTRFPRVGDIASLRIDASVVVRVVVRVGPLVLCDTHLSSSYSFLRTSAGSARPVAVSDVLWVAAEDLLPLAAGDDISSKLSCFINACSQVQRFRAAEAFAFERLRSAFNGFGDWPAECANFVDFGKHADAIRFSNKSRNDTVQIAIPSDWESFHVCPPVVQLAASVLTEPFEEGFRLNVLDTANRWYGSTILDVRAQQIFVTYGGWAKNWDEWISITDACHRLAPLPESPGFGRRPLPDSWHASPICRFVPWREAVDAPDFSWAKWLPKQS